MGGIVLQTSLIAAYVAGMVALFAPCCITFLLPAYLANVFKEKEKVLFMTLVFGAGIFVVLLPAVIGVSFISQALFRYHDPVYIFGGVMLLLVAITTFLGIKLPMPSLPGTPAGKTDVLSIFTLGIVSGITSACCAPVLIGILTLTFLSANFFGAIAIGAMYVLGMVTPLLLISLFLNGRMPGVSFLRKELLSFKLIGKTFHVITSNLIASIIFLFSGWIILVLTLSGKLAMSDVTGFTKQIQNTAYFVNQYAGNNLFVNLIFVALIIFGLYKISKKV